MGELFGEMYAIPFYDDIQIKIFNSQDKVSDKSSDNIYGIIELPGKRCDEL